MRALRNLVRAIAEAPPHRASEKISTSSSSTSSASTSLLTSLLDVASVAYGGFIAARRALYDARVFQPSKVSAPVISVGNITWGGCGKTPMAEYIARECAAMGATPAVLARGYRGADEAWMLRRRLADLRGVSVLVGRDRLKLAREFLAASSSASSSSSLSALVGVGLGVVDGRRGDVDETERGPREFAYETKFAGDVDVDDTELRCTKEQWQRNGGGGGDGGGGGAGAFRPVHRSGGQRLSSGVGGDDDASGAGAGARNGATVSVQEQRCRTGSAMAPGEAAGTATEGAGAGGKDEAANHSAGGAAATDVIILDDGMQHLRLARELEVVMVNALARWGSGRLVPRGPLRELPARALGRAHVVALHHHHLAAAASAAAADFEREVKSHMSPDALLVHTRMKPTRVMRLARYIGGGPKGFGGLSGSGIVVEKVLERGKGRWLSFYATQITQCSMSHVCAVRCSMDDAAVTPPHLGFPFPYVIFFLKSSGFLITLIIKPGLPVPRFALDDDDPNVCMRQDRYATDRALGEVLPGACACELFTRSGDQYDSTD